MGKVMRLALRNAFLAASIVLISCGGGGGGSSSPPGNTPSPEGLWVGQTSAVAGSTARSLHGLIFETGEFWFFYNGFSAGEGFLHGTVTVAGSSVSSSATDYNFAGLGIQPANVSGTFTPRGSLNGAVTYTTGGVTFTTLYSSQYDAAPTLTSIAATYARLTVAASGSFTGSLASGCLFSGNLTPRTRGSAFTVALAFGGAPCANGTSSASGIAYFDLTSKVLYLAAITPDGGAIITAQQHP